MKQYKINEMANGTFFLQRKRWWGWQSWSGQLYSGQLYSGNVAKHAWGHSEYSRRFTSYDKAKGVLDSWLDALEEERRDGIIIGEKRFEIEYKQIT